MKAKVTILSKEEIYAKYPMNMVTNEAIYSRATVDTNGCFIACIEGIRSDVIVRDLQKILDNYLGPTYKAEIYKITDMTEYENNKIYWRFSK